ncbi:MAG TPA: HEAT repeat domain-containing protein, partial [Candidatus Ozemobacteraceae bacterium]|nr:HEAT repeat domain-containing protein [Candidatus Ozemobacteraceae bacterium]
IQIAVATATRREAIEDWLAKNLQTPEVASFVEKLAQNPSTEEVYKRLAGFLPEKASLLPPKDKSTPQHRPESDKLRLLAQIDKNAWEQHSQWIREEARFGSPALRAAALQALATLSADTGDLPLAETAIQQDDPDIQLAAFKLLEARAPERLIPRLPALLASSAPKVRGRAIRFALKRDEKAAIAGIDWMLRSQDRTLRAQAVSCLFLFPFEKVSGLVLRTLETEDHPAIARQLVVILLSNPTKEILDKLDKVQTSTSVGVSMLIAQARMDLFDILLKLGIDVQQSPGTKPPAHEAGQTPASGTKPAGEAARPAGNEAAAKAAVPSKPYSVAEVRQTIRNREAGLRPFAKKDDSKQPPAGKSQDRLPGVALLAAVIIALGFLPLMIPRSPDPTQTDEAPKATTKGSRGQDERRSEEQIDRLSGIPTTFRMGKPCKLSGTMVKVLDKQCFTFESETRLFRCTTPGSLPMMLDGEQVAVEMLPYRKLPNGQIAADVTGLTLIK